MSSVSDILKDLDNYLQTLVDSTPKVQKKVNKYTLSDDKKKILSDRFSGWQAPIKGNFENSGAYGRGDSRHNGVHDGVDLRAPGGTSTYPISEGFVEKVANWKKGGNIVTILHDQGVRTYYAHLGTISVNVGEYVDKNTVIGSVGNSGNAKNTTPHIHLEVRVNGNLVDPGDYFEVPSYTNFDKQKEKLWLSQQAKDDAHNFNINEKKSKYALLAEKFLSKYS